jgi:hydrogenase nickel incorporation protein HypA/HybF
MHEMSIIINLFEVITGKLRESFGTKPYTIRKVILKVGKLSAVVPEVLRYSFSIARSDDTFSDRFREAELEIEEVPIVVACKKCQNSSLLEVPEFRCLTCGSRDVTISAGRELFIESVEIDE